MNDWKEIAITSDVNTIFCACKFWDIKTGNEIIKIRQGSTNPRCLAFIKENHVICGSKDPKVLNVWALYKQVKTQLQIKCIAPINALAVSFNGSYCVGAISTKLYVWKVSTGQLIAVKNDHHNNVTCVKFDENESYFVSGAEDGLVIAWSMTNIINSAVSKTCETALMKPLHVWNDHTLGVRDVHITSWGLFPRVFSVSKDKMCKIYDLLSGVCVFSIYTDEELYSLALDPLGCYLYLGTGSGVIIKSPTNSIIKEKVINILKDDENILREHRNIVTCLSVSIDGRYLLSGSNDATAVIWDLNIQQPLQTLKHDGPVTNAYFQPYPHFLDEVENKKKGQLLIKPFQFIVSPFDNEMVEVYLPSRKLSESGYESLLDSFYGEEEILPQIGEDMKLRQVSLQSSSMEMYKRTQFYSLFSKG